MVWALVPAIPVLALWLRLRALRASGSGGCTLEPKAQRLLETRSRV